MPNVTGNAALGYWPAFWMLGGPFRGNYNNWPSVGEIDIMENVNGRNSVFSTLHCGPGIPGTCNETTGLGSGEHACTGCLTSFHTYRMEWDKSVSPQQLRWYLDGNNFFTLRQNQVDAASWTAATNHGYMIILDLAIGGGFPAAFGGGPTAATVSGVPMLVDYVRIYQQGGGPTPTPSGPTPTPSGPTPTPTRTPTPVPGDGFTQNVVNVSSTQARPYFQPSGWTAGYVILHYIQPGLVQQNVNMTFNTSTARWEYTISGISSGQVLQYSFTYQKSGLQFDTGWFSWTKP
jgi:beta-glucanase (GH16 family)